MAEATTSLRNRIIDTAISAGKFAASRRAHYEALWERSPTEACLTIAALAAPAPSPQHQPAQVRAERGVRIVAAAGGGHFRVAASSHAADHDDSYPTNWLSDLERGRIAAAKRGAPNPEITLAS